MKRLFIILWTLSPALAFTQPGKPIAVSILQKTMARLAQLKKLSYHHTRETHYYADNYQNLMQADLYLDFTGSGPIGLQFQADEQKSSFVYDGKRTLRLDKENRTIDSSAATTMKSIQNNSYLYHSLAMLRRMLPLAIGNDSLQKTVSDTLVGNKQYYNVRIEGAGMYFTLLGDIDHYTAVDLKRPYYLLIDKKTFLPYQFISKYVRGTDDRDFVTVTYSSINTKPEAPANSSWEYASYADTYKPYVAPVKIPVVKPGTILTDFTLPAYSSTGTDSVSLNQYKGKLVLLDFWFKSCGPCMEAMPHYNELQTQFRMDGFELLTVNVEDPVADIKFFYDKHQPIYKMMYGGGKLWHSLGFTGCPSSVLLDRSGKVVEAIYGFNKEQLSKKITALLKQD
ncbi:MAG: TlpA disulfide reductase family protein [Bacteroidota bacterium]